MHLDLSPCAEICGPAKNLYSYAVKAVGSHFVHKEVESGEKIMAFSYPDLFGIHSS